MRQKIIDYLIIGKRIEDTDSILIDRLIQNIDFADECVKEIDVHGVVIPTQTKFGEETKINPSFIAYNSCLRSIERLCTKLGITPQDRQKLKLVKTPDSELEKDFHLQ